MSKLPERDYVPPERASLAATAARRGVPWRVVLSAVAAAALVSLHWPLGAAGPARLTNASITAAELAYGLAQCTANRQRPEVDYGRAGRQLAALRQGSDGGDGGDSTACTILRNATLVDGDGTTTRGVDVAFRGGIVVYVGGDESGAVGRSDRLSWCPPPSAVIDVGGRYVSPGLIDMHSHVGLRQEPQIWANEDVTESSQPVTPWARAIDGFKPTDAAIRIVASGGTTTSLVLTGATNLISGEGMAIKHRATTSVWDQEVESSARTPGTAVLPKRQRHLKMACGENIKAVFQNKGTGPVSRQGASAAVRFSFEEARTLMASQDAWCDGIEAGEAGALKRKTSITANRPDHPYPTSLRLQTLVDVMRGDMRVHVHCYQPQDVYAHYDHADEFGYNITALHHITQAHEMLDEIRRRGTLLATFSDEGGFKNENYHRSWYMLRSAAAAGIPIALTTDHPAKHGQFFAYEAQIAHHFMLDEKLAMASLLSVPAKGMGLDNRIGWIRPGYDADLVVWDAHPLTLGSTPLQVFIDGQTIVRASDAVWARSSALPKALATAPTSRVQVEDGDDVARICVAGQTDIVLRGIKESFLESGGGDGDDGGDSLGRLPRVPLDAGSGTVVIRGGIVQCIGDTTCDSLAAKAVSEGVSVMTLRDGYLLPGIVAATRSHGLTEMVQEPTTQDGILTGDDVRHVVTAADGLQFGDQHLTQDHRRGITALLTAPASNGFLNGITTGFRPGAANALDPGTIVKRMAALQVNLGDEGKTSAFPTISMQFDELRRLLTDASPPHDVYALVANGTLPLVVRTDNKDVIAKTLALQRDDVPRLRLVVFGGGEAHLLADALAAADVPVVLAPPHCSQLTWEVRNCLPGPPLTDVGGPDLLMDAGVTLGLGSWDHRDRWIPNLLWEAAWLTRGRTDWSEANRRRAAVALVTANMRAIFGLPRRDAAEFVVYEGDPLEYGASVALIVEQGAVQRCWPDVE